MGEWATFAGLSSISVPGILTLAVLAVLFGLMFPRPVVTRAWRELDAEKAENKELRATLDRQAGLLEKMVDRLDEMKVVQQATLYAMQEIQVAGRHAAGMDPIARTAMQNKTDEDRTP